MKEDGIIITHGHKKTPTMRYCTTCQKITVWNFSRREHHSICQICKKTWHSKYLTEYEFNKLLAEKCRNCKKKKRLKK